MDTYINTDYLRSGTKVKRRRWVCKPCMATHKKIHRLRKLERWDELDRAIEAGEHSRAARIQANRREMQSQTKAA